jgi:hypothetical protein
MYAGLRAADTLHKKPCRMGPGLSRTSENFGKANFGEFTFPENRCKKGGGTIPAGSELNRRAGAKYPARMLFGPHGEVRLGGLHQHGRLEAVPGCRSHRL